MQNCKFCGALLPDNASFCGYCGNVIKERVETPGATSISQSIASTPLTPPPVNPLPSSIPGPEQQDSDRTLEGEWPGRGPFQNTWQSEEQPRDKSQTLAPDMLLPGMFPGEGLAHSGGQVPLVHGTPQMGQVPTVQGPPSMLHSAIASGPPSTVPGQVPPVHPVPPQQLPQTPPPQQYQQLFHQSAPVHSIPTQPLHHPAPTQPEQHAPLHHHQSMGAHQALRPHRHRASTASARSIAATTSGKLTLVAVAIVVVAAAGLLTLLLIPSAISLNGSGSVTAGGTLRLHGKGFLPGGSITFSLDKGAPVQVVAQVPVYSLDGEASIVNALHTLVAEHRMLSGSTRATVSVTPVGTFDATVAINTNWSGGTHTIHAMEGLGSRTATLSFTVIPLPTLLIQEKNFNPNSSNCLTITASGNLTRGWLCTVTLNASAGTLSWSASSTDPNDQLTPSQGVVHGKQAESVSIFIPSDPHCSNATITFRGRTNAVSVSWSCPA